MADALMMAIAIYQMTSLMDGAGGVPRPPSIAAVVPGGAAVAGRVSAEAIARAVEAIQKLIAVGALDGVVIAGLSMAIDDGQSRGLGTEPRTQKFREAESRAAARLEQRVGPLRRDPSSDADWIDLKGKTYDAVGPVPPGRFDAKSFLSSIERHLLKSVDYVVVDLEGLGTAERALVEEHLRRLPTEQQVRILVQ